MQWLKISVLVVALSLFVGGALAAEQDDNLCYTTQAGNCNTDLEWNVGWYWANNPPSADSCAQYHDIYDSDIWGMCSGIDYENSAYAQSQAQIQLAFELTSQSHALPDDDSNPCPFEGLDPIIDYENGTYTCGTSF